MSKQLSAKDFVKKEEIEVKTGDLIAGYEAIILLSRMEFPVLVGFKISSAYKVIHEEVKKFEDLKDSLRSKYATEEKLENGQRRFNFGENEKVVEGMIKDEMMKKVTLKLSPLTAEDLAGVKVQPSILSDLEWLIRE